MKLAQSPNQKLQCKKKAIKRIKIEKIIFCVAEKIELLSVWDGSTRPLLDCAPDDECTDGICKILQITSVLGAIISPIRKISSLYKLYIVYRAVIVWPNLGPNLVFWSLELLNYKEFA